MIRIGTSLEIRCSAYALQHPQISALYKPAAASCFCHHRNFSTRSIRNDAGRKISAAPQGTPALIPALPKRSRRRQEERQTGEHIMFWLKQEHWRFQLRLWILLQPQHRGETLSDAPTSNVNFCMESRELQEGKKREQQAFILVVWWIDGCSASWLAGGGG